MVCQATNVPLSPPPLEKGKGVHWEFTGVHWEVDLTKIKPGRCGFKYLLVFVDTFSGWVEAFPTKNETALMVGRNSWMRSPGMAFLSLLVQT